MQLAVRSHAAVVSRRSAEAERLVAECCGRSGLDLEWPALTRGETDNDAPERQVASAIVDWLGGSSNSYAQQIGLTAKLSRAATC